MQMRYAALLSSLALLLSSTLGTAEEIEDAVTVSGHYYRDSTTSSTYTGKIDLKRRLSEQIGIGVGFGVDGVTAATPSAQKIVSGKNELDEENRYRYYPSIRGIYDDGDNNAVLGGYYSREDDYTGRSVFFNYTRLLNMQNTSLGIGVSQSFDTWEISDLPDDDRDERFVTLTASQLLSPTAQIQFIYTNYYGDGYLASPYKYVRFGGVLVRERLPSDRTGNAFSVQFVKLLNEPTSLHLYYRYYFDDWEIDSHTVNLELYRDITDRTTLGGRFRFYTQTDAEFTKDPEQYTIDDKDIAIDYKWSDFDSYTAGLIFMHDSNWGQFLLDWSKVKIKASFDYYWTSDNDHIKFWWGESNLTAFFASVSLKYLY